jgi:hypothetical protein
VYWTKTKAGLFQAQSLLVWLRDYSSAIHHWQFTVCCYECKLIIAAAQLLCVFKSTWRVPSNNPTPAA